MSKETEVLVKNNDHLVALFKGYDIPASGQGTKFWVPVMSEKAKATCTLHLSSDGEKPYMSVEFGGTRRNVKLQPKQYNAFIEMEELTVDNDYDNGIPLECVIAPRVPNPALTEEQIVAIENLENYGTSSTKGIRAALLAKAEGKNPGELFLISFEESEE